MTATRHAPLGSTDILVSPLGLGTVKFGRNQGVKYPTTFELPSDQHIEELLADAQALGVNLLDTAPAYGNSEERIGKAIKRSEWVLSTKVGEEFDGKTSRYDFTAKHCVQSIHRSLKRLKTDFIDIALIHSDGRDLEIIESSDCLATLAELKSQGLIRSYGMSTKTVAGGLRALEHCDLVMVTYNLEETADKAVIDRAEEMNKGVFIKKAFNSGNALHAGELGTPASSESTMDFIFSSPGVSSVIAGTLNAKHLAENYRAVMQAQK